MGLCCLGRPTVPPIVARRAAPGAIFSFAAEMTVGHVRLVMSGSGWQPNGRFVKAATEPARFTAKPIVRDDFAAARRPATKND